MTCSDLSGSDLSGSDLSGSDLSGSDATRHERVEQTVLVFYRVETTDGVHHYQASVLRTPYHGARPGEDLVRQIEHVGTVCAIEPGTRVRTIHELRSPRTTREEVESEVRAFLAERHGVPGPVVVETGRHVFDA